MATNPPRSRVEPSSIWTEATVTAWVSYPAETDWSLNVTVAVGVGAVPVGVAVETGVDRVPKSSVPVSSGSPLESVPVQACNSYWAESRVSSDGDETRSVKSPRSSTRSTESAPLAVATV
jgi:hypothetical protein